LTSSVLRWPNPKEVEAAVHAWVRGEVEKHGSLVSLGYFGSYARGESGVGSDLDLVAIVESSREPFERRALEWDLSQLPLPAEILVYTRTEWDRMQAQDSRFARTLKDETVWIWERR
jgi:predicted nucleotidyltransferase